MSVEDKERKQELEAKILEWAQRTGDTKFMEFFNITSERCESIHYLFKGELTKEDFEYVKNPFK